MLAFKLERDDKQLNFLCYIGTRKYSIFYLKTPSVVAMACSCNDAVREYSSNLGFLALIIQRSAIAIQQITN